MQKGILGLKVGMTQLFDEAGNVIPVTVIQAGPCPVLRLRTADRDGYQAVQLGFQDKPRRLAGRADRGQVAAISSKRSKKRAASGVELLQRADCEPQAYVREIRMEEVGYEVGHQVTVSEFADVSFVDVVGTSRGRGYSGVMRRHNFSGQRATHGVKKCHRHGGSTGMSAAPSRTFKGKRMSGQYGNTRTTARNLKLVKVDEENGLLLIRGAVPGPNGGFVVVSSTNMV